MTMNNRRENAKSKKLKSKKMSETYDIYLYKGIMMSRLIP